MKHLSILLFIVSFMNTSYGSNEGSPIKRTTKFALPPKGSWVVVKHKIGPRLWKKTLSKLLEHDEESISIRSTKSEYTYIPYANIKEIKIIPIEQYEAYRIPKDD